MINWFDVVAVSFLVTGIIVGRKRGMSSELPDLIQWVLIVGLGALLYKGFGNWIARQSGLSPLLSSLIGYLLIAALIAGVFLLLKRFVGDPLISSDIFGRTEYYLGMVTGGVRFLVILLFCLALFHAPQISDAQLAEQVKQQQENLGAIYFPPYGMIQRSVFKRSLTGSAVDKYLSKQLVEVYSPGDGRSNRETIYRRREREINEILQ